MSTSYRSQKQAVLRHRIVNPRSRHDERGQAAQHTNHNDGGKYDPYRLYPIQAARFGEYEVRLRAEPPSR